MKNSKSRRKIWDAVSSVIFGAALMGVTGGLGFWIAGRIFG